MEDQHETASGRGCHRTPAVWASTWLFTCIILCLCRTAIRHRPQHIDVRQHDLSHDGYRVSGSRPGHHILHAHGFGEPNLCDLGALIVTLFVFAALQDSWTDSFRMERDAPRSSQTGPSQSQ